MKIRTETDRQESQQNWKSFLCYFNLERASELIIGTRPTKNVQTEKNEVEKEPGIPKREKGEERCRFVF